MSEKLHIRRVWIEHAPDECPDLSWLGVYSNTWQEGAIDRKEAGTWSRGEFQYWIPGPNHYPHKAENWAHVPQVEIDKAFGDLSDMWQEQLAELGGDKTAVLDNFYVVQDWNRMEDYGNGWSMIGVIAKAEVQADSGTIQVLRSGGCWGVEEDSDGYVGDIEREELAELAGQLAAFGLGKRAITRAIARAEKP